MPGTVDPNATHEAGIEDLTPRQIADELDRFIVGQASAKRAVAIALRNRLRRRRLTPEMAEEVMPKNILMIGPTGVGKTEIARRLARLAGSPFIKLEATKFTEVGYVGRDVESMIRDLVEVGIELIRQEKQREVAPRAKVAVQARLLDLLLPPRTPSRRTDDPAAAEREREDQAAWERSRKAIGDKLERGELEDKEVELEVTSNPMAGMSIFSAAGMEEMDMNMKDMMPGLFQGKAQRRKMSVGEAREILQGEEEEKLIDSDRTARDAIKRVEESGIVFLDEMDKIAGAEASRGPDVSREGVQRDLLPIVEGTLVKTKHGMVRTDHILFVAAGAFHLSKPSDLIPELQGRFPIRVELESLGEAELVRILTEPESSLVKQYVALMETEGVTLDFTDDGVRAIAAAATQVNEHTENIGARRLLTIMERLLDEVSFAGSEWKGQTIRVDADYVQERLADVAGDADISRFVL